MQMITYKLTKVYISIFLSLTWVELGIQNAVGVVSYPYLSPDFLSFSTS